MSAVETIMQAEITRLRTERDQLRQYLDAAQRRGEELREQLALAESVRAAQVAGLTEGAEKLRERVRVLECALRDMVIANEQHSLLRVGDVLLEARAALKGEA